MLKKLLSIIFLTSIAVLNNCMEKENPSSNDQQEKSFEEEQLDEKTDKDLILSAIEEGNIEEVKKLTNFDTYFDLESHVLQKARFLNYLKELGLTSVILDEIFLHDKINYLDDTMNRYLQALIKSNKTGDKSETILRFIRSTSVEELNAQDAEGYTALLWAANAWEMYNNKSDQKKIIEALLEHGADPEIGNIRGVKASDSVYFDLFDREPQKTEIKVRRVTKTTRVQRLKRKSRKSKLTILKLAGVALVGTAILYMGYRFFKKNTRNVNLELK